MTAEDQISLLARGTEEIISPAELADRIKRGRPLRVKAGFDPTAPDLHLGHAVLLQKLKAFQELGHQVLFVIGDFTARIGDPSGVNETRPALNDREIRNNVKTYEDQIFRVLDRNRTQTVYNSAWLEKLNATELIRLSSKRTVARMLERDDFEKRYKKRQPIGIHEFIYPILQAYDSVELRADVEIGGTDQKFNLLLGRELQKEAGQESQIIMTLPLLIGTDGVQKMSKSLGNSIGIMDRPNEMFGRVMSISDEAMWNYFALLSSLPLDRISEMKRAVKKGAFHPMEAKLGLAREIVSRFHGEDRAREATDEFEKVFRKGGLPSQVEEVTISSESPEFAVGQLLVQLNLAPSRSEARRLIQQGAVTIDEARISEPSATIQALGSHLVQVGRKRFKRVRFAPRAALDKPEL